MITLRFIRFIIYFSFISIFLISIFTIVIFSKKSENYLILIIGLCLIDIFLFVSSFYIIRKRISFTEEILKKSLQSVKNHPLIVFLNLITTFSGFIINTIIVTSAYGYISKYENNSIIIINSINIYLILILSFLLFSYYYFNEIVKNIIHVTIAGTTTFFLKGDHFNHPIGTSFKHCISIRFGSICFGSLFNTFVRRIENTLIIISYITIPIMFFFYARISIIKTFLLCLLFDSIVYIMFANNFVL